MAKQPLLSIIITSYAMERLKDIYELLDSIEAQTYPNIETIFVAEKSMELFDQIKSYVEEKSIGNVKVIFNDGEPGASAARNLGIKHVTGDIIDFVDDDALLFPDWAEETVKTYENESVIGVIGPVLPLWEDPSMSWFPEELHWIVSCTTWFKWEKTAPVVGHTWASNASFRRESFNEDLFDTALGPRGGIPGWRRADISEDVELSLRVQKRTGKNVVYNSSVKVLKKVSKNRFSLPFVARNAYRIGLSRITRRQRFPSLIQVNILPMEKRLLKRIFTRLFPDILKNFFIHPAIAWRKLRVTVVALSFVAIGYSLGLLSSLFRRHKPSVERSFQ